MTHNQIARLAKRFHDSGTLKDKFDRLVTVHEDLDGEKRALDRRVPTQWNSELDCLKAHLHFRTVIEALTSPTMNGLAAYHLSFVQWGLAEDVANILTVSCVIPRNVMTQY